MTEGDLMAQAEKDLSRCSHCGRTGTLTSLSAGNTCVLQDDCEQARQEALARVHAFSRAVAGPGHVVDVPVSASEPTRDPKAGCGK